MSPLRFPCRFVHSNDKNECLCEASKKWFTWASPCTSWHTNICQTRTDIHDQPNHPLNSLPRKGAPFTGRKRTSLSNSQFVVLSQLPSVTFGCLIFFSICIDRFLWRFNVIEAMSVRSIAVAFVVGFSAMSHSKFCCEAKKKFNSV